jgi:hypothetical protein
MSNKQVPTLVPTLPPQPLDIANNLDKHFSNTRAIIKNMLLIRMLRCFKSTCTNDVCEHWYIKMHTYLYC